MGRKKKRRRRRMRRMRRRYDTTSFPQSQRACLMAIPQVMTEEQKMEEGKRMFSIFAARMFEQRVLNAYRERVAQERQLQLLRELEDEDKLTKEREAKKQSQNQKKKDKKRYAGLFVSDTHSNTFYQGCKSKPRRRRKHDWLLRRLRKNSERSVRRSVYDAKRPARPKKRRSKRRRMIVESELPKRRSGRQSGNA